MLLQAFLAAVQLQQPSTGPPRHTILSNSAWSPSNDAVNQCDLRPPSHVVQFAAMKEMIAKALAALVDTMPSESTAIPDLQKVYSHVDLLRAEYFEAPLGRRLKLTNKDSVKHFDRRVCQIAIAARNVVEPNLYASYEGERFIPELGIRMDGQVRLGQGLPEEDVTSGRLLLAPEYKAPHVLDSYKKAIEEICTGQNGTGTALDCAESAEGAMSILATVCLHKSS